MIPATRAVLAGLAVAAALLGRPSAAAATQVARPPGEGVLVIARGSGATAGQGARADRLPLLGTRVSAHVLGFVAQVEVHQTFNNPFDRPLEAIYMFPLPHDAAVSALRASIGDRTIQSHIARRKDAVAAYRQARRTGRVAALLEEERPNIFTQSVVNIPPGAVVEVAITYDVALDYRGGAYEFVYPMVVGPRDIPGTPIGGQPRGHGTARDTDQVPDASRVTPPTLPAGQRSGRNVTLEVDIDPGRPMASLDSPTHEIAIDRRSAAEETGSPTAVRVSLVGKDRIPNKDFVLRYRLARGAPVATLLAHRDARGPGGTFALLIEPPHAPRPSVVTPRELVLVVDTSASMAGKPLALVKRAARRAVDQLGPRDTFRLVRMADTPIGLSATPLPATAANRARARAWIDQLQAAGQSALLPAMRAALHGAPAAGRLRVVCLLTDGFVGNEKAVLAEVEGALDRDTRLFTLGVGSSVNRYLLDRLAQVGRGAARTVLLDDAPEAEVDALCRRIRAPLLTGVTVEWRGLDVAEVVPPAPPDLFAGQPVELMGRFERAGSGAVVVRGRLGGRAVSYRVPVSIRARVGDHEALPRLLARRRIRALLIDQLRADDPALIERITRLGLSYRLVTPYTAFVAVDREPSVDGRAPRVYVVPVDLPAGVGGAAEQEGGVVGGVQGGVIDGDRAGAEQGAASDKEQSRRIETAGPAAGAAEEVTVVSRAGATAPGRWRFAVGAGLGGAVAAGDRGGHPLLGSLHLAAERGVTTRLSLGVRLGLATGAFDRAPDLASILIETHRLLLAGGALELAGGLGAALAAGADPGLALSAALRLGRGAPRVEVRYLHALIPGGPDTGAATLGFELSF